MPHEDTQPGFGLSFAAVLAAGFATSWLSTLFIGFTPNVGGDAWLVATDLVGAIVVRLIVRALGYSISYVSAVVALVAGTAVSIATLRVIPAVTGPPVGFMPTYGLALGIPGLLLSAWLVQTLSSRPRSAPSAST